MLIVDLFMPSNTGGLSVARQLVLQGKASRERKKKQQQQIIINGGFDHIMYMYSLLLFIIIYFYFYFYFIFRFASSGATPCWLHPQGCHGYGWDSTRFLRSTGEFRIT